MITKLIKENSHEILEKISELEEKIFHKSAYSLKSLSQMLEEKEIYSIYIYMEEKELIGYLIVMDSIDCYEVLKIAVLQEHRQKKIGETLLKEVIKEKDVLLEVRETNEIAIKFYTKYSFKEIARRKNYYKDSNETAIIMKMEVIE